MELIGYLIAVFVAIWWGTVGIFFSKMAEKNMGVYDIIAARMIFAFLFGIVHTIYTNGVESFKISFSSLKNAVFMGVVAQGLVNIFLFLSIEKTGIVVATLLMSLGPIFTVIFSVFLYKEKLTKGKIFALVVSLIGTIILISDGALFDLEFNYLGVAYGFLSGICFGFYPIISKSMSEEKNPDIVMIYSFIVVVIMLLPLINFENFIAYHKLTCNFLVTLAFSLIPTLMCHLLFVKSLNYISASKAGILSLIQIPSATIFGMIILGEKISFWKILGMVLIIFGIFLIKLQDKIKTKS